MNHNLKLLIKMNYIASKIKCNNKCKRGGWGWGGRGTWKKLVFLYFCALLYWFRSMMVSMLVRHHLLYEGK